MRNCSVRPNDHDARGRLALGNASMTQTGKRTTAEATSNSARHNATGLLEETVDILLLLEGQQGTKVRPLTSYIVNPTS